jgi:hypothetical protein
MASRISQARQDFLALQADMNRGLLARAKVEGLDEALAKARELRAELERAQGALPGNRGAAPGAGQPPAGARPGGGGAGTPAAPRAPAAPRRAATARPGGGGEDDEGPELNLGKSLKYIAKQAGIGKAAMAALGAASTLELAKLALGYRGMAQLQALGMRAGLQFRSLFRGVDSTPVIRAYDRLLQLVNPATASGKAISRALTEGFNSFFRLIERAEPLVSSLFKLIIIGAQDAQIAWLRLRIATLPLVDALGELGTEVSSLIGPLSGVNGELGPTADDFREIADFAREAAAAVREFNSAVGAVKKGTFLINAKQNLGMISPEEAARQRVEAGAEAHSRPVNDNGFSEALARKEARQAAAAAKAPPGGDQAAKARASGNATGQAYAEGMGQGVDAGQPGVAAAGARAMGALDAGARRAGRIQSPSKLAEDTGYQYPRGTVRGVERGAPEVEAAGAKLVPQMGDGGGGAARTGRVEGLFVTIKHEWSGERPKDARAYEAAAEAGDLRALRTIAEQLGISVRIAGAG